MKTRNGRTESVVMQKRGRALLCLIWAHCFLSLLIFKAFVGFYLIYTWGTEEFEKSRKKNPATYENDH